MKIFFVLALSFGLSNAGFGVTSESQVDKVQRPATLAGLPSVVTTAEADITLRRFKASQLTEQQGLEFLKRVEQIRKRIGKQQ